MPNLVFAQDFWQPLTPLWEEFLAQVWPGPLSFLWPASSQAPECLVSPQGELGLRCPRVDHGWFHNVLMQIKTPLPTCSANNPVRRSYYLLEKKCCLAFWFSRWLCSPWRFYFSSRSPTFNDPARF